MPSGNCCRCCRDLLDIPAAADIMADDRVKHIAAIGAVRSAAADNLLDLVDAVAAAVAVEAVAVARRCSFCSSSLAALAPDDGPVEQPDRCW